MSNKCPQCGFPEHESGECPYARPKGEKYDYVEAVLIPVAEPSLSLLEKQAQTERIYATIRQLEREIEALTQV